MAGDLVTPGGLVLPARALTWRFSRGTGPGGQGVNTTDSRVELVVDLTALVGPDGVTDRVRRTMGNSARIVVTTARSPLQRLSERLDVAARPRRARVPTRRTAGSVRRRLEAKRRRSLVKSRRRDPDATG